MAGKDLAVRATPSAAAAIKGLRGTARKSYDAFEAELRKQGCKVAGYRLLGAEEGGYSEYCCKRLTGNQRRRKPRVYRHRPALAGLFVW